MPKIQDAWESYLRKVVPGNAGATQIEETRRAFYAGVAALFDTLIGGVSEGSEPTEADDALIESIHAELQAHIADMAGLAARSQRRRGWHRG